MRKPFPRKRICLWPVDRQHKLVSRTRSSYRCLLGLGHKPKSKGLWGGEKIDYKSAQAKAEHENGASYSRMITGKIHPNDLNFSLHRMTLNSRLKKKNHNQLGGRPQEKGTSFVFHDLQQPSSCSFLSKRRAFSSSIGLHSSVSCS